MDKSRILDIVNDVKNKPNKDIVEARDFLAKEFDKTKNLIIELTHHMDSVQEHSIRPSTRIIQVLGNTRSYKAIIQILQGRVQSRSIFCV